MDKLNIDSWREELENALDENFPKHKCKERGNALVFHARAVMIINQLLNAEREEFKKELRVIKQNLPMLETSKVFIDKLLAKYTKEDK